MATKLELRNKVKTLLNNSLCTDALADEFIRLATNRASRLMKIPEMEVTSTTVIDENYLGYISQAADYQSLIEIRVDVGTAEYRLTRASSHEVLKNKYATSGSFPTMYFKEGDKFYIYPTPRVGDTIKIRYYGTLQIPANDGDSDVYSNELEDVVAYTALVFAADHFVDDRKQIWMTTASELAEEIDAAARIDDMSGLDLRVSAPYAGVY